MIVISSETLTFGALLQGNLNCSLYSESTYRSDTSMEDFLSRNQEPYESHVQGRRRLDSNGTEFGPAMVAAEYETYFLVRALNTNSFVTYLRDDTDSF